MKDDIEFWLKEFGVDPDSEQAQTKIEQAQKYDVPPQAKNEALRNLQLGKVNRSDKETLTRLKKGRMLVNAKLDLHGYIVIEARIAFYKFIKDSAAQGCKVVLVITGKGSLAKGGGEIKNNLPHWLNDEHLKPHILTCCYAPKNMGGEGAVLFLLSSR